MGAMTSKNGGSQVYDGHNGKVDPLFNAAFLRIFGEEGSKRLTCGLANAMLRAAGLDSIGEVERIEADHPVLDGSVGLKTPRVDVRLIAADRILDIEAQGYQDALVKRFGFYASKLLASSLPEGDDYERLPRVAVIALIDDFVAFSDTEALITRTRTVLEPADESGEGIEDIEDIVLVFVELEKFRRRYTRLDSTVLDDEALAWMYLLTRGYASEEETAEMAEKFLSMEEFGKRYGIAAGDPKISLAYEQYLEAERDYRGRQRFVERREREAREKALAEGKAEGRDAEREAIRMRLEAMGMDQEFIDEALAANGTEATRNAPGA